MFRSVHSLASILDTLPCDVRQRGRRPLTLCINVSYISHASGSHDNSPRTSIVSIQPPYSRTEQWGRSVPHYTPGPGPRHQTLYNSASYLAYAQVNSSVHKTEAAYIARRLRPN